MKQKFIRLYIDIAIRISKLSYAKRLQVGAIVVKDDRIISMGYNGTPAGWDNKCEGKEYATQRDLYGKYPPGTEEEYPNLDEIGRYRLKTKPEVMHAESNAISKLAKSAESGHDAAMFLTHSPCMECAKLIYQSGIKQVYYRENYRSEDGVYFLQKCGIKTQQISDQ